ncbi:MAG: peroxygenase [Myxococcota bacterium]|jgi:peroxygenase
MRHLLIAATLLCFSTTAQAGDRSALQLHADFFDITGDGWITWSETYTGCRQLGFSTVTASGLASAINLALGAATNGSTWTINIDDIHLGKHGSDTGVYDADGNYVEAAFEALFETYDVDEDDALSDTEFEALYTGQYTDLSGSLASKAEFGLLMDIAGEVRTREVYSWWYGTTTESYEVLTRDTLESFYDGSLFYDIAGR